MALVPYVSEDPNDDRLGELLAADADRYGRPSLFARVLAHDPALLAARQTYVDAVLDDDVLDERLAELVDAAVAAERGCPYCVASHAERLLDHVGAVCDDLDLVHVVDVMRAEPQDDGDVVYTRLHGLNEDRYDYDYEYGDNELAELASTLRGYAATHGRVYCLFNNYEMYDDARALQARLER